MMDFSSGVKVDLEGFFAIPVFYHAKRGSSRGAMIRRRPSSQLWVESGCFGQAARQPLLWAGGSIDPPPSLAPAYKTLYELAWANGRDFLSFGEALWVTSGASRLPPAVKQDINSTRCSRVAIPTTGNPCQRSVLAFVKYESAIAPARFG